MTKKIILAVIGQADTDSVVNALVAHQYTVTRLSSTGGFLRRGNTTILVGVDDPNIDSALDVIRTACQSEENPEQHRATIFVLNASAFEQV
jgi:uncharacterized protein YaaQ